MHAPSPPLYPGHWFWGSFQERIGDPLGIFERLRAFAPVSTFRFFVFPVHVVAHPTGIKEVLVDHAHKYKKGKPFDPLRLLLGNGLFTAEGETWKRHRRLAQPSFHRERLAALFSQMLTATEQRLESWSALAARGQTVDLHSEMMGLTMSIVARTLFSTDVTGDTRRVYDAINFLIDDVNQRLLALNPLANVLPTKQNRRFRQSKRVLDDVVLGIIRSRREKPQADDDLLAMLMNARDEETGEGLTDLELRDEVMTLFLAGHETTANALTWAFYLLHEHPHIQQKVRAELASVLGDRRPTLADLPQLKLLARVFDETLRLYPPAWIIGRELGEDDVVMGHRLKRGRFLLIPTRAVHRHPEFWPDPEAFDPERFTPERSEGRPRGAYLPFGLGQRMCIGNNFALMESALILAMSLQRFMFTRATKGPIAEDALVTLRPHDGLPVTLTPIVQDARRRQAIGG